MIDKERSLNAQSDALVRPADALAGLVRHALEGRTPVVPLFRAASERSMIRDLRA